MKARKRLLSPGSIWGSGGLGPGSNESCGLPLIAGFYFYKSLEQTRRGEDLDQDCSRVRIPPTKAPIQIRPLSWEIVKGRFYA